MDIRASLDTISGTSFLVKTLQYRAALLFPDKIMSDIYLWNNLATADREGFYNHLESTLLLKRVGEAEDIAQAIVYLTKQSYTTGQSLVIDGGAALV